ncbi:hypothetical protein [Pseudovibrio sp. Tun.PSC04-5.I4]|uniref:hypothetical protein n=1 Tax=Pseudovibrio sp. Tun.PSC04-5.I4 TaxID=1798213 RepID=UPI000884EBF4|nr:hypothetical protein [Pseudovibrio sp. Tun.PSC04-5.I4]SDQ18006.1 hypothetical protein SAMN04515695_0350 [Pseudovibrio sp. Tun.PSC04-5.I4]
MTKSLISTQLLHHLKGGECQTLDMLDSDVRLSLSRRQFIEAAGFLTMKGYLERVERGCYQLTQSGRKAADEGLVIPIGGGTRVQKHRRSPRRNSLRQRAWNAMKISGAFTLSDIVLAAAQPTDKQPESNLQRYLRVLFQAGYLTILPVKARSTKPHSNGFRRFRLIRDTGPLAPVWSQQKSLMLDFNLTHDGEVTPCK